MKFITTNENVYDIGDLEFIGIKNKSNFLDVKYNLIVCNEYETEDIVNSEVTDEIKIAKKIKEIINYIQDNNLDNFIVINRFLIINLDKIKDYTITTKYKDFEKFNLSITFSNGKVLNKKNLKGKDYQKLIEKCPNIIKKKIK